MAWFQNLAGRAEDFLNQIDQNAATVLNESNSALINIEGEVQNINNDFIQEHDIEPSFGRNASSNSLIFPRSSPIMENNIVQDIVNMDQNDPGITFDVMSEQHQSSNGGIDESSARSVQLSTSSSSNNSVLLAEEWDILYEKVAKLEFENQDRNKQLLNMQHLYSELKNENTNLQFQIERCNEQVCQAQLEKDQYIANAQRILQEKEKLIALKENMSNGETSNIFQTDNEELKKELEFHQLKNDELTQENNQLINDMQSLQMQHQIIHNSLYHTLQNLEQTIAFERQLRATAEEGCALKAKDLQIKSDELIGLKELKNMKDNEVIRLKEVLKRKVNMNINKDTESKIKFLTQTVMLKQNRLEKVTTERNALRLQIEKLESEYKKNLAQLHRAQVEVINIQEPDETISVPRYFRVSPFDAGVTRRVKHAYSTLDAISIRTGIFLRRYPVARVFVFCYMVLLHIWVLIILFLYAPNSQ